MIAYSSSLMITFAELLSASIIKDSAPTRLKSRTRTTMSTMLTESE
jgi:hypothetical protein